MSRKRTCSGIATADEPARGSQTDIRGEPLRGDHASPSIQERKSEYTRHGLNCSVSEDAKFRSKLRGLVQDDEELWQWVSSPLGGKLETSDPEVRSGSLEPGRNG